MNTRIVAPAMAPASTSDERDAHAMSSHETGDAHAASMHENDPDVLARTVGDVMYAADEASRALGMRLDDIAPGRAMLTMRVRADMLNGHRTCHGGFIFSLADSAFAFACNSRNVSTVASGCTIDFLAPVREGDVLTATAHERSLAGRTGIYDVTVRNEDGHAIAVFRGRSYRIRGQIVGE
jgi:acyl-CoA thioesterase